MGVTPFLRRYFFSIVIALFVIVASFLGAWGYAIYAGINGKSDTWCDIAYITLQLFVLESGNPGGSIPWQFEVARFLAPVVAAWAIFKTIAAILGLWIPAVKLKGDFTSAPSPDMPNAPHSPDPVQT